MTETLPASWYHDDAVFAREQDAIFARNWSLVARDEQLSHTGDFVTGAVAGRPIFVIRQDPGTLRGFHNVCRHRAGPVVFGTEGQCKTLRCRYHGWVYDLAGRLKKAPGFETDDDFSLSDFNLFEVRVESWNGLVFVCLDRTAPGLREWLGEIVAIAEEFPPLSEMSFFHEDHLEGRANWKAYGDNSAEGYHLPYVHRALTKAVVRKDLAVVPHDDGQFVAFRVTYRASDGDTPRAGCWIYKFPGLLLHYSDHSFNLERVVPLDAHRVRLVRWFWFREDGSMTRDEMDSAVAESTSVMREDLAICEAVQRNLEAGVYQSGRLSPTAECGTLYIQRLVRASLGGDG